MAGAPELQLLHNPACSKSNRALELLRGAGIEPDIRLYLDDPLDRAELLRLIGALDEPASSLIRARDADAAGLEAEVHVMGDEQVADWLSRNPATLQRPILLQADARATICRPPERVLELLPA